jgi:hypothetical protein
MSSDGVETTASTSSVNSSGELLDQIVKSVLDGEHFKLPDYFPEELLRLATNEDDYVRDAKAKNDIFLLMVVLGLMAAHMYS